MNIAFVGLDSKRINTICWILIFAHIFVNFVDFMASEKLMEKSFIPNINLFFTCLAIIYIIIYHTTTMRLRRLWFACMTIIFVLTAIFIFNYSMNEFERGVRFGVLESLPIPLEFSLFVEAVVLAMIIGWLPVFVFLWFFIPLDKMIGKWADNRVKAYVDKDKRDKKRQY